MQLACTGAGASLAGKVPEAGNHMATTASTNDTQRGEARPRYASVQDYLRVIRRRKILIAAVVVVFVGGALAISATQEKVYEAQASVNIRDVFSDLRFIPGGGNSLPELGPAQRAALSAEQITGPEVAGAAKRLLDSELPVGGLLARVDTQVGIQTNLVSITASAPEAAEAAEIANAFAAAAKRVIPRDVEARLKQTERNLRRQLKDARDDSDFPGPVGVLKLQLSQISILRQISEPVEIARQASAPGAAVSPQPARNAVLGAILGLVFGLIAAFGRDSLDRRLRTVREVHDGLGIPVLGKVSEAAFRSAGLVRNGLPMLETDFEAFRVLRTNLAFAGPGETPRTVVVTSGLPEEGKSTVAMSLASAAALSGHNVLLVECDLRRPSFERRLKIKRSPGLADYLSGAASPAEILQVVDLDAPLSFNGAGATKDAAAAMKPEVSTRKFVCIAAGSQSSGAAELLATARFHDFLEKVRKAYDLVVLDTGPLLAVVDPLEIVPLVDMVLVCARLERTTHEEAHATRDALGHLPDKPMGAVVTGIKRGTADASDYYYGY